MLPPYPDWIIDRYPTIARRSEWVEVLTYIGMIGGSAADYVAYVSFARDERWGRAGLPASPHSTPRPLCPADMAAARAWLRAPLTDVILSFTMVVLITAVFVVLGAHLLTPARLVPHESAMLTVQARFLTELHPNLFLAYVVGIVTVFGGTIYGSFEVQARAIEECWRSAQQTSTTPGDTVMPGTDRIRRWLVAFGLTIGPLLIWTNWDPIAIMTPASLLAGVFACGLSCFAMLWVERQSVVRQIRMRMPARLLLLAAGIAMTAIGVRAIVEYVRGFW